MRFVRRSNELESIGFIELVDKFSITAPTKRRHRSCMIRLEDKLLTSLKPKTVANYRSEVRQVIFICTKLNRKPSFKLT